MPSKLELLERTLEQGFPLGEDVPTALADPGRVSRLQDALAEIAAPALVVEMVGDQDFRGQREGVEGFLEFWRDWAESFERFRVEIDDAIESGEHLVTLVRQIGRPRGGVSDIENAGAAVWTFEGETLVRVEFHLDRTLALRAAGIEPG